MEKNLTGGFELMETFPTFVTQFADDCQNKANNGVKAFFESSWGKRGSVELKGFQHLGGRDKRRQPLIEKATTAGRNTVAKCSPKERSTLPRRPILQKYLSRLANAVLGRDFRDGFSPVKQSEGRSRGRICPSHSNRNQNQ